MNINEPLQRLPEVRPDAHTARESAVAQTAASSQGAAARTAAAAAAAVQTQVQKSNAEAADKAPSKQELDRAISSLSSQIQSLQRSLQFSVDKDSGDVVVKIVDTQTREVIRQIPSQELLDLANSLKSMTGLLLKDKV